MKTQKLAMVATLVAGFAAALPMISWAQEEQERAIEQARLDEKMAQRQVVEAQKMAAQAAKAAVKVKMEEIRIRQQNPFAGWAGPPGAMWVAGQKGIQRHLTQIQEAAERYRDAKDEAVKEKALQRLHDLASKYFEEDMEVRKKELAEIEARLDKLRSQLDRRRAKKDEIVDLQVKVAINEAEGLGFTSAPRESIKFDVRVAAPAPVPLAAPKFDVVTIAPPADVFRAGPVPVEAPIPPPGPPSDDSQQLTVGAKGEAVRLLQKALNEQDLTSIDLKIDGDFGPDTEKAVRDFQAAKDLIETGVVDEATRKALGLPDELPPFIRE